MITNDQLEARGYKKWNAPQANQFSDCFYQKRFSDDVGIKYHIEFVHYPKHVFENGQSMPESWMVALNNNEPHFTFQFHRPKSIDEAESKCETFFKAMGCEYYELHVI